MPSPASFAVPVLFGLGLLGVFWPILGTSSFLVALFGFATVVALMVYSSPVIEVTGGRLRVGKAQIKLKYVGLTKAVPKEDAFAERGNLLDARAYTKFQPSVATLLRCEVVDPADPTPYWLFSTRRGDELERILG